MKASVEQLQLYLEHLSVDVCFGSQKLTTEDMKVGLQARRF